MNIITYHDGKNIASRIIPYWSKKAGHWKESDLRLSAPSHILTEVGDRYFEADWGERWCRFLPFPRINGGVREVTLAELNKRSGYHVKWEIDTIPTKKEYVLKKCERLCEKNIEYDFRGLFGAAWKTYSDARKRITDINIDDKEKFFCSEFVAYLLVHTGHKKKIDIPNNLITPALLPKVFGLKYCGRLKK